jgi:hypothetical protein
MKWQTAKLGDVCEIVSGATPKTAQKQYWDGDIYWATPKDLSGLNDKIIKRTQRKITATGLSSCAAKVLPKDSVLFSSRAPIGLVAVNDVEMATNQGFKSFVPNANVLSSDYLYWWLKTNRVYLNGLGVGATFKEVSKSIVERVEIPLQPLAEQKRIAAILDKAAEIKAKREQAIAKLDELAESKFVEMFGNTIDSDGFQRETTQLNPVSPYGCAKVFSYNICRNYRNSYNMKIWNGILFNHESPRRGTNFVTNKVVKAAVKISLGLQDKLHIGNLSATRDWGHAKDYVYAMWLMLQSDNPDDYVCSTGVSHSVGDLCSYVFSSLGLDYQDFIVIDEKHFRPEELENLKGDSSKLRKELSWKPEYTFETMLDEMINYWLEYYKQAE